MSDDDKKPDRPDSDHREIGGDGGGASSQDPAEGSDEATPPTEGSPKG